MSLNRRTLLGLAAASLVPTLGVAATARFKASDAAARIAVDHGAWDGLLETYVRPDGTGINRIAYRRWKSGGRAALDRYLAMLETVAVTRLSRAEQYAFWVNLYNARTIAVVLDHYPVASIRDINLGGSLFGGGPWSARLMTIEGEKLSLDDVEHKILRPIWGDPRTHYAVNCASIGCPNLARQAYTAARTGALLEAGARAYVGHPRGVNVADGVIEASKIYDWFAEDFGDETRLRRHWTRYADPTKQAAIAAATRIGRYSYDWSLNDAA